MNVFQQTKPEVKKVGRGWNVRHITRVSGYFSYVENWNPGKKAELDQRHRENDTQSDSTSLMGWYRDKG